MADTKKIRIYLTKYSDGSHPIVDGLGDSYASKCSDFWISTHRATKTDTMLVLVQGYDADHRAIEKLTQAVAIEKIGIDDVRADLAQIVSTAVRDAIVLSANNEIEAKDITVAVTNEDLINAIYKKLNPKHCPLSFDNTPKPSGTFTDDFTGTNDDLLVDRTGWSGQDAGDRYGYVYNNNITFASPGSYSSFVCTDQGSADHYAQAVDNYFSVQSSTYLCVRLVDEDNFIAYHLPGSGGAGARLCKMVSGSLTDSIVTTQGAAGYGFKIECDGTTIRFYRDTGSGFTQVGVDQTIADHQTETSIGFVLLDAPLPGDNTKFDDFEAGTTAAGTASPNVAQSIDVAESVSLALQLLNLSIDLSETVNIAESIAMQMPLGAVSVYDGFDLTEALTPSVPIDLTQFDNLTVGEFLNLLTNIAPQVFDGVSISEFVALLKDIKIDVSETVNLTEVVAAVVNLAGIDTSENINLTESVSALLQQAGINVSETINIIEYVDTLLSVSGVDVYDTLTVAEYVDLLLTSDFGLVEHENINLSEVVDAILSVAGIDASQAINISEFVGAVLALPSVTVDETLTVAEFVSTLLSVAGVDVSQSVTVAEFVNMSLSVVGAYQISVFEILSISEVVTAILSVTGVSVGDTVQVVESVIASLPLALTVSDLVQISEYVRAELETTGANVSDSLTVAEFAAVLVTQYMAVVDETITIAEYINVVVESLVRGEVGISWSIQRPKVAFSIKRPKINFTF